MTNNLLRPFEGNPRYLIVPGGLRDVHVHFRDPGVPEAEREKIFDFYYQIARDSVAARGLGYYRKLIVDHCHVRQEIVDSIK